VILETAGTETADCETAACAAEPEWVDVLGYENLPGCPHPLAAVCV
jgi:hypothetical protein